MKDALGNVLREGHMILWRQTGLIGKVTAVRDSDLSINKDDKRQPDSIDVLITLAVPKGQRPDFLVLVNPEDTSRVVGEFEKGANA
jgi:hypothetical protein